MSCPVTEPMLPEPGSRVAAPLPYAGTFFLSPVQYKCLRIMHQLFDKEALSHLSEPVRICVQRLVEYFASSKAKQDLNAAHLKSQPYSRLAAVLVLLYEKEGALRVLLTTRAKTLRTHGGQTSLPGGKMEETDESMIQTAFREAMEEVSLPLDSPHIHTLGTLDLHAFHKLIVTPVVALLTDNSVLDTLQANKGEVDHIFSHPLEAILEPEIAPQFEELVPHGSEHWPHKSTYHHFTDHVVDFLGGSTYRWHYFRSSASPVTGMTADVLLRIAGAAYNKQPTFDRYASNQLRTYEEHVDAYKKHQRNLTALQS